MCECNNLINTLIYNVNMHYWFVGIVSTSSTTSNALYHAQEYIKFTRDLNIPLDDVSAFEKLSKESFLTTRVEANNEFKGLSHLDSAVSVSEVLFSSLNYIEENLRRNLSIDVDFGNASESKQNGLGSCASIFVFLKLFIQCYRIISFR